MVVILRSGSGGGWCCRGGCRCYGGGGGGCTSEYCKNQLKKLLVSDGSSGSSSSNGGGSGGCDLEEKSTERAVTLRSGGLQSSSGPSVDGRRFSPRQSWSLSWSRNQNERHDGGPSPSVGRKETVHILDATFCLSQRQ